MHVCVCVCVHACVYVHVCAHFDYFIVPIGNVCFFFNMCKPVANRTLGFLGFFVSSGGLD